MSEVLTNLIAGLIATALATFLAKPLWRWARRHLAPVEELKEEEPVGESASFACPPFPEHLPLPERIVHLERTRDEALAAGREARARGDADTEFEECGTLAHRALHAMTFILPGDLLEDRLLLKGPLGAGRLSVVWKAYDKRDGRFVAVKFLRQTFINDESLLSRFEYTASVVRDLRGANFAAVLGDVRQLFVEGRRKVAYCVLECVEGEPLDTYAERHPDKKAALLDGLLELGRCLADAHSNGVVHRDLKPSNILVQPNGVLKVVDFDSVLRLRDRRVSHHDIGTFGYSAPEVLSGTTDLDVRADIFALGRVFSYLYYGGRGLPSVYEKSVYDVIDLLNCAPIVKDALERATAVPLSKRHESMKTFIADLATAVQKDREEALPFVGTLRREREKIYRLLRHSFYGTFALMILARPLAAWRGYAHLSDRHWVGGFHAIIGSLVWGVFIAGAFLLCLVLFRRRIERRWLTYLVAAFCCGVGGFLGGLLVSVPSVFVTNAQTLTCLGWLSAAHTATSVRLWEGMNVTRMMLAFPLTGLLTGIGTGLALYRGIEIALRMSPQGSGVLPVPSKRAPRAPRLGIGVCGRLLRSPVSHLMLAFPALFGFVVSFALNPAAGHLGSLVDGPGPSVGAPPSRVDGAVSPVSPLVPLPCGEIKPNVEQRSIGEGIVHYCGAVGLVAGFFWGIPATTPTRRPARQMPDQPPSSD
jgi:hypothetical protein